MNDTMATKPQFDRTAEDLGNVVELGHVNVTVPDQSKAIAYYLMGLGLTRDPYLMAGLENMWVNVGRGQFHLPSRDTPQVVRGTTALVMPDLEALLKRLDYVYKKPKCVPAKADAAVQERFATETLLPLMAQANAEHPLYFVDGMHPAYTAHPAFGWIKRGVTRELKSNHGRVNVNINGALSWPDREVVHLQAEKITSEAMIALFETLAARHPGVPAIKIVLDNASYNHSAAVKAYLAREDCRIQLVFLPPYAPNLNLIERLWWLLKKTKLWNEHYPTFADFKAAIDGFFRDIGSYREQLTSLITDQFRFIGAPKSQPP